MMLQRQYILVLLFLLTSNLWAQKEISSLSEITIMNGNYKLTADVDASGNTSLGDFTGTLDGDFHKVTGLTHAIFNTVNGDGVVKNIIFDNVTVSANSSGFAGAVANYAKGTARIYNCGVLATNSTYDANGNVLTCSSTISGTTAGSIVGQVSEQARVLNCFSYANVNGSTNAGGIVGERTGTAMTRTSTTDFTPTDGNLIFNCVYFGSVIGGSTSPIFGGSDINNVYDNSNNAKKISTGINTYNYFLYDGVTDYTNLNSANGAINKSYFNRFNLYRDLLNSHRDLCAMYINNTETLTDAMRHDIAIWDYSDETKATIPYLHLEKLQTNTRRTLDRTIPVTSEDYKGRQLGTVSCTFNINGRTYTESLPITDMNKDTWDYTWGKIILPFANEFSGWTLPASGSNDYDKIITGWEITSITGGTSGAVPSAANHYNFCDPDNTAKDLYANNNYVWAQGGFFVVPNGVTSITFTAHIVNAYYLCDPYPDEAFSGNHKISGYIGTELSGDTYNGKKVYHTFKDVYDWMENKTNPADQAIVLIGNYHVNTYSDNKSHNDISVWSISNGGTYTSLYNQKAATITSIDADSNQLPDYSLVTGVIHKSGRSTCPPTRFDFICCPGIAVASYTRGGMLSDFSIMHSAGWFEVTETSFLHMTEYEVNPFAFKNANSPVILNGGIFERFILGTNWAKGSDTTDSNFTYFKFGGKVYITDFKPGNKNTSDQNNHYNTKPVNICGGQIDKYYLTSRRNEDNAYLTGDAYIFSNSAYIKLFQGSDQGQLRGSLYTDFRHTIIDEFYGGGILTKYTKRDYYGQITGDISHKFNDCIVGFFVAGPKFGNMGQGKTLSTEANNTTFGEYYGAGYGGTSLANESVVSTGHAFGSNDEVFPPDISDNYTPKHLNYNESYGTCVSYTREFYIYAGGGEFNTQNGNKSFARQWATLSLAQTRTVSSTMTNCTFEHDFYGGGHQGMVNGDISSTLTNCRVNGSVYGGGYKAEATPIYVYPTTEPGKSVFKGQMGIFTPFGTAEPEVYKWVSGNDGAVDNTNRTIGTSENLANMGKVVGYVYLTINGGTVGQDVYGGGNESPSAKTTSVTIGGNAVIGNNVYGGGALADVGTLGDEENSGTYVRINEATINGNVYGGGKGEEASDRAKVYGETIVVIGQE